MATRTINLLPLGERRKRKDDALNYYTLIGGMVVVTGALFLAGMLLLFDQLYRLNLNGLQEEKRQAESQASQYLDVEKKSGDLEKQIENLRKAHSQTTHWAVLLSQLQALTPSTVAIKTVDIKAAAAPAGQTAGPNQSTKTEVVGSADSRRNLGEFQLALASSPYFRNVEIQTSNLNAAGAIEYSIALEINYDKLDGPSKL